MVYLVSGTQMGEGTSPQAVSPVLGSCKHVGMVETSLPQTPVYVWEKVKDQSSTLPHISPSTRLHLVWVIIYRVILDLVGAMDLLYHP